MDEQQVRKIIRDELQYLIKNDKYIIDRLLVMNNGRNIQLGTSVGTQIGTESTQKLALFGATPVSRRSAITSPSGGSVVDTQARTAVDAIRQVFIDLGATW